MKTSNTQMTPRSTRRRGSTLIIVIALLGLLAFTGMVFFSFASQERAAAEYFSDAAKAEVDEPDNVWDHPLRHIISGPSNRPSERGSILRSPTKRHSMAANLVGADLSPHSGQGIETAYNGAGLPVVVGPAGNDWMDCVDSPAARGGNEDRTVTPPGPDVDYNYPDINTMFLAYKGWAIRDNGSLATPRYERVPIIIPSFFRPQYMKTSTTNGNSGSNTPTDLDWATAFDGTDRTTAKFQQRSFRPAPIHIAGRLQDGTPVYRYLTDAEAAAYGITSGGFPFVPDDTTASDPTGANGVLGELGIWTGSDPDDYELDADNDGDGIREGIWIDTHYPVQEDNSTGTPRLYTVLHSFTIYDLDGLMNVTVHGNLAGLNRGDDYRILAQAASSPTAIFENAFVSRSNLGLGPNEINPLWALRRPGTPVGVIAEQFTGTGNYGTLPALTNTVEQANMEYLWLLAGRAKYESGLLTDILPGRWGEQERLYSAVNNSTAAIWDLPRPGRPGEAQQSSNSGIGFGGGLVSARRNGFDDNQDRTDGELNPGLGRVRAFGTPMDYAGTGRSHLGTAGAYATGSGSFPLTGDIRLPISHHDTTTNGPERFQGLNGYSLMRSGTSVDTSVSRYVFGQNATFDNGTGDDLIANTSYDPLFEDPLESIFDSDLADTDFDRIFGPQDLFSLHLEAADLSSSPDDISHRVVDLAPYSLDVGNAPFRFNESVVAGGPRTRSRFTTLSNSLHRFMMRSPFGSDGRPGMAGVDDDGDGATDEPNEVLTASSDTDSAQRYWEFSADTDGSDTDNDGFGNGDGFYEFPPSFGAAATDGRPYSATDPFRPQVRRLITTESGEGRGLLGQMPLSPNHILDVERNTQTPAEGTREFYYYMQRAGMRFRALIDHPLATESTLVTAIPSWNSATPITFPPQTPEHREFWARRDRQKLARDMYVLLYTTGGAGIDTSVTPNRTLDYTIDNLPADPAAAEGVTLYTHDQLRRMAQFAVNMVDAMDSDNVITKFEFDKNLGNGWNMDDDPYATAASGEGTISTNVTVTGNGLYPEDGIERGIVYGVEAQELAISETQGIRSNRIVGANHPSTPYDDDAMARDFMYVELQNPRPTPLTLGLTASTTATTAVWRLGRYDRVVATDAVGAASAPDEEIAILQHTQNVIDGGGRFSVSVASDASLASSAFFVKTGDPMADTTYELIAPDAADVTLPTGLNTNGSGDPGYVPLTDIDAIHDNHNGTIGSPRFAAPTGNFLETLEVYAGNNHFEKTAGNRTTFTSSANRGFDLVLQRRANPNLPQLSVGDNPWIEVDRTRVTFDQFAIADGDTATDIVDTTAMPITGRLAAIQSLERSEPLDDISAGGQAKTATIYRKNTLKGAAAGVKNDLLGINAAMLPDPLVAASAANPANGFDLWQVHFDREFASTGELLSLPLVGPNLLTQHLTRMRYAPYQQVYADPQIPSGIPSTEWLSSGESMLLQPDFPGDASTTSIAINTTRDNRWYRLFQFVEVPSRVHRMLGNYLTLQKIPGKININMIRHREVLAGLLDNPYLADVQPLLDSNSNTYEDGPFMTSIANIDGRDAWHGLINDRDGAPVPGYDPVAAVAKSFWIPGTPNANPYRSFGTIGTTAGADNGIDRSILRRRRSDRDDDGDGIPDDGVGFDNSGTAIVQVGASADSVLSNRHWLEMADPVLHATPQLSPGIGQTSNAMTRQQMLSKILNNTTTVSNTFIVYGTAAYFEVYEDPTSGLFRIGGRFDLDGDGDETNDQQRAVFVIDRTDAFEAYDPGTGDFDWKRLVKAQATIE